MSKAGFWQRDGFLGLAAAMDVALAAGSDRIQSFERKAYDTGVRPTHHRAPSDRIAVVAIHDASPRKIGRWPRDVHARITGTLATGNAKVVGNLVFFTEPQIDPGLRPLEPRDERADAART